MTNPINIKKQVSCRVTNSVIKYLESKGYNVDPIVEGLPYSKEYLCDTLNWVTYEVRETICSRAAELTKNDAIMFDIGLSVTKLNPFGGVESMVRLLTGPKTAYKFVPRYAKLFDNILQFRVTLNGKNKALIEMSLNGDYPSSQGTCY